MRYRGLNQPFDAQKKRRTREHVIADLSYNFLERKVLQRGHWLDAPQNDYGVDAIMFHHNKAGGIENGEVRFQLKATDRIRLNKDGRSISQIVALKDLRYWYFETYPLILVLYDALRNRAFWLHVQDYVNQHPKIMDSTSSTISLRIPTSARLTLSAIDRFRNASLKTVSASRGIQGEMQ